MSRTERRGPYLIEYGEDLVVIRCKYPFVAIRSTKARAVQHGVDYVTRPLAMNRGVSLVLRGEGLPEEVVEDGGYPGGAA